MLQPNLNKMQIGDTETDRLLHKVFPCLQAKLKADEVTEAELSRLHKLLQDKGRLTQVYRWFFAASSKLLHNVVVPEFWAHFTTRSSCYTDNPTGITRFHKAVKELFDRYSFFRRQLKRLEKVCPRDSVPVTVQKSPNELFEFQNQFHCTLLGSVPHEFNELLYPFYSQAFLVISLTHSKFYVATDAELMLEPDQRECEACDFVLSDCQCVDVMEAFISTNRYLMMMGLLERLSGATFDLLIQDRITTKVMKTKENYSSSHMAALEHWLNTVVFDWLICFYNNGSQTFKPEHVKVQEKVERAKKKVLLFMYEQYSKAIIEQFFQIIINFPMSRPAVDDLKLCLSKINTDLCFETTVREMLCTRLLHPGVDTPDILSGYVAALKTLAHFDASAVLLRGITQPIKEYLRGRPETVRCVVTSFTGDGTSDLAEELAKGEKGSANAEFSDDELDESNDWENWQPDPVNKAPATLKFITSCQTADIISMVVDIYGTKEIFVIEYRNLLAERLLSQVEPSIDRDVKQLELLKSRFGDTLLHSCDVMLKDMTESKRINAHILSADSGCSEDVPSQVSALIVSSQFWPTFRKETMELPATIKNMFERYTKAYESYKVNRTLQWKPLNGKVTIELEHNGKVQEMQVTPAQAAIAIHFSEQSRWELDALALKMNMPPVVLRKRIAFWQAQGIIREGQGNVFDLIENGTESENASDQMQTVPHEMCEEEEAESAMESASDQREEELQVFWSYIEAMLTNLDSLPLDRIHQMLKMFASQVDFTQDELKHILQRKVREHKLVYAGGVYQLPKS
uniref:Anaphase-promoting complex subunit 2 n=1 Tax=Anopheles farauti TaxID=69004 RepID=A0A182Q1F4_9DIPT